MAIGTSIANGNSMFSDTTSIYGQRVMIYANDLIILSQVAPLTNLSSPIFNLPNDAFSPRITHLTIVMTYLQIPRPTLLCSQIQPMKYCDKRTDNAVYGHKVIKKHIKY